VTARTARAKREQIIDAAARLIHLRGYRSTSIEEILRATGIGKGNFYYYFASKEELGFAILDWQTSRFAEGVLQKAFGDKRDPLDQIHAYLDLLLELARKSGCRGGCPVGNLAQELSDTHEGFRRRLDRAFEAWRAFLEGVLRRARTEGRLRRDADPARLSRFLLAGIEGAILLAKVRKDPDVLADCFGELRAHLAAWTVAGQRRLLPAAPTTPASFGARRRLKAVRPS
jgi:TetR/AcrR family transcriptional repressor of nem operon